MWALMIVYSTHRQAQGLLLSYHLRHPRHLLQVRARVELYHVQLRSAAKTVPATAPEGVASTMDQKTVPATAPEGVASTMDQVFAAAKSFFLPVPDEGASKDGNDIISSDTVRGDSDSAIDDVDGQEYIWKSPRSKQKINLPTKEKSEKEPIGPQIRKAKSVPPVSEEK
jgi:hypothetical protein